MKESRQDHFFAMLFVSLLVHAAVITVSLKIPSEVFPEVTPLLPVKLTFSQVADQDTSREERGTARLEKELSLRPEVHQNPLRPPTRKAETETETVPKEKARLNNTRNEVLPLVKQTSRERDNLSELQSQSRAQLRGRYKATIVEWLERHKRYPLRARKRGIQGQVLLSLSLNADGEVLSFEIVESSGSSILDGEVLDMVRRAKPFPRFPDTKWASSVKFHLPIRFQLT